MVKIPDTNAYGLERISVIWQPPNPWEGLAKIAKRVGVEPVNRRSVAVRVRIDAGDGKVYDAFEVIECVLDYIDNHTKSNRRM